MKLTYISPCFDSSGYAEAARNYILALDSVGVDVHVKPMTFEKQKPELGDIQTKLLSLSKGSDDSKIQITHMTPENYPRWTRPDRYNIAYTTWETSRLPPNWAILINRMNEVWVPCEHNVKVFRDSGVTVPIKCVPHTFTKEEVPTVELSLQNREKDDYAFYSIFQWTERKNPIGLLKAYLTEFKEEEKVCLILKTYFLNPLNPDELKNLKETISSIKQRLYLKSFPKILLINSLLSKEQIVSLHNQSDCYVSLHRCEGFGIPIVEAMMAGKPVIATSYGGPADFGNDVDYPVMYHIGSQETPCFGMPWPTYHGGMNWAEPNIMEAREAMRTCFTNQQQAKELGADGKHWCEEKLSYQTIGTLMKNRLLEIEKEIL